MTIAPPSEPPESVSVAGGIDPASWKVVGTTLLIIVAAGTAIGTVVATSPRALDAFVRNQRLIWLGVASLVAYILAFVGWRTRRFGQPTTDVSEAFIGPTALPFSIAIASVLAAGSGASAVPPVPPETGYELVIYNKNEPGKPYLLLFVHGWRGDAKNTWKKFPELAAGDSRLAQYNVWSVDYPTFMFKRNLRIAALSDPLHRVLDKSTKAFEYQRVVVIAHSMGGLVARQIFIQRALGAKSRNFDKLIEVATPHQGAQPARLAAALQISDEFAGDMIKDSGFLAALTTNWNALALKPPTYCIGSPQDRVVSKESATFQCSDITNFPSGGHTDIVKPEKRTDLYYSLPIGEVF